MKSIFPFFFIIFVVTTIECNPLSPKKGDELYIRVTPGAVLRQEPTLDSEKVGFLNFGTKIYFREISKNKSKIFGQLEYWYKIQIANNGTTGWVFSPLAKEHLFGRVLKVKDGELVEVDTKVDIYFFDKTTNLYWMTCNMGQEYIDGYCQGSSTQDVGSITGDDYCKSLTTGNLKWNLPSLSQLKTISSREYFLKFFIYSEFGAYVSITELHSEREDYFVSLDIPEKKVHSYDLDGAGYVKCVAE